MFANIVGRRTTALATTLAVVVGLAITPAFTATAAEGDEPIVAEQVAVVEEAPAEPTAPVVESEPAAPEVPAVAVAPLEETAPVPVEEAPAAEEDAQAQSPIAPLAARMAGPAAESEPAQMSAMAAQATGISPSTIGPFTVGEPVDVWFTTDARFDFWSGAHFLPGVHLSEDGHLTGTFQYPGTAEITVSAMKWRLGIPPWKTVQEHAYSLVVKPAVTTASLPNATVGDDYDEEIWSTNPSSGVQFSYDASLLPPGLRFTKKSGFLKPTYLALSGKVGDIPQNVQTYNFWVTSTVNGVTSDPKWFSITIGNVAPTWDTFTLPDATVGVQYPDTQVAADGKVTLSYTASGLPAGLGINSAGLITGTPTGDVSYAPVQTLPVTITADNGKTTSTTVDLVIKSPASVTTTALPEAWLTQDYNAAITTAGPAAVLTATDLPAGLSLIGNAVDGYFIDGIPTAAGDFTINLVATNAAGSTPSSVTVTVNAAPAFTTPGTLPTAITGTAYTADIDATGKNVTYSLVKGPAGMVIDPTTGILSGWTPPDEVNVQARVVAENLSGSLLKIFTIRPFAVPTVTPTVLDSAKVGTAYSDQIVFDGRSATIQKTAGTLPDGVSLTKTDGTLSGTPTQEGVFTFAVTVTNSAGSVSQDFEIRVHDVPVIQVTRLDRAVVGQAYTDQVQFSGLDAEAIVTPGTLPAGLGLNTDGTFSGVPNATGVFNFTVTVSNPAGSVKHKYRIVSFDVPKFVTTTLNPGVTGAAYSQQLVADGHGVTFVLPNKSILPAGLVLERNGELHGVPTIAGDYTFDVRARNFAGKTLQTFTVSVTEPVLQLSAPSVIRGNTLTVTGSGYLPGDDLELWLHSTPVLLGTVTATNGTFTSTVVIPANTEAGAHHLFVQGTHSGTQSVPLTVALPAPAPQQPQSSTQARSPQLTVTPADTTSEVTEVTSDDPAADEVEEADEDLPTLNKPVAEGETTAAVPADWSGLILAAFVLLLAAMLVWFLLWRRRRAAES